MFMSKHFVFPPSQHGNLPVQPDCSNSVTQDSLHHNEVSRLDMEEGEKSEKFDEDSWNIKGLEVLEELHHSQFFDEKGENSPLCEESISFQRIKLVNKEDIIDMNANLCSYHDVEASLSASTISESTTVMPEPGAAAKLDSSSKISESHNPPEEDIHGLPCEAWWKKCATSWYSQAKDANALWSVVVAAALMGFVVIGHRWQRESSQGRQLKLHFSISDEITRRPEPPLVERVERTVEEGERTIVREVEEIKGEIENEGEKVGRTERTLLERLFEGFNELKQDEENLLRGLSEEEMAILNDLKMEANKVEKLFGRHYL